MKRIHYQQLLPISINEAWDFFSSPKNLNLITPPDMVFEIKNQVPDKMYKGLIIQYKVRPFLNIPLTWVTEITQVEEKHFFIDEQRIGPYRLWHHEHHFEQTANGVLVTDLLYYSIGKSLLGWLAGVLFVHQKVRNVFKYREHKLNEIFSH
ncbi:MAG TPA: SRPBCC family protein [Prolixibacteraceae bacterium]|nr:SRPBCC family protein [Prolixibacteraceae bacterium]HPR61726.1 SRPBCC family protein [Prolixibacteraceae bacterium]